jgi:hypothetical protein
MSQNGSTPPSPPPPPDQTRQVAPHQRTWPAVLTLVFLSPIIGEMLSGSTPLLMFFNPFSLFLEVGLYGSGAILIRELVRRRGLDWRSILLLGAAYGILEEGLVVTSWFNPYWPDLGVLSWYGRFLDTSWVWAMGLTLYHAVVSITIPILLTELIFPQLASRPWLGKRALRGFTIYLTIVSVLGLLLLSLVAYRNQGYTHPPLMYLGAIALAIGFAWLGLHLRPRHPLLRNDVILPGLWLLRALGFATTLAFFFTLWVMPQLIPLPIVPMLVFVGMVWLASMLVSRWSDRVGWGLQHRLALASGVIFFFVPLSFLVEFAVHPAGKITTGQSFVGLFFLVVLIILAWRVRQHTHHNVVVESV